MRYLGPEEFTHLARSTESMRTRLVTALTERERAEQGFRRLFESAPDATLAVAADGTIALANPLAEQLFRYPPGDLAGQHVEALVPVAGCTTWSCTRHTYKVDRTSRSCSATT